MLVHTTVDRIASLAFNPNLNICYFYYFNLMHPDKCCNVFAQRSVKIWRAAFSKTLFQKQQMSCVNSGKETFWAITLYPQCVS